MKKFFKISLVMATMAIVWCSCDKDDDEVTPENTYNGKTTAVFNSDVSYGTMTDLDGNVYKTVTIGTQTWMAENLRTTQYNDGTPIPNVTDDDEWAQLTTGAYCNYNNTVDVDTIATFGRLYNFHTINTGKLAPIGWHVSTEEEWYELINFLGNNSISGGKIKEIGTTHWHNPNKNATNATGFTALPSGYRTWQGTFSDIDTYCYYGSYPINAIGNSWSATHNFNYLAYICLNNTCGTSVRCVKD